MKRIRKIATVILVVIMMLTFYSPVDASPFLTSKANDVIVEELRELLLNSEPDDLIPVDIWFYEVETSEKIEQRVRGTAGIDKQTILNSKDNSITSEEIDKYIITERTLYAEKQTEFYGEFQKDYVKIKGLQSTRDNKSLFISKYAPMIRAELSPAEIKNIAQDSRVQNIYYSPEGIIKADGNISMQLIRANYTRDTLGYTGNGIKIGMIEEEQPGTNNSCFDDANIIYDPNVVYTTGQHADIVAAIMVAKAQTVNGITYQGIVPDATLYASYCDNINQMRVRTEWMISQGVNIINISASDYSCLGTYCTHARWFDHVALNHSVHIVKSAGNNADGVNSKIPCPSMAYNLITVGSISDKNTTTHADDVIAENSCYIECESSSGLTPTNKPDLVAPGQNIHVTLDNDSAGFDLVHLVSDSGTSFSTPHVTAVVAQLCQARPALKVAQDAMKAILTASISHSLLAYSNYFDENFDKYGAGVVDAYSSYYTAINGRYVSGSFGANSGNGADKTYTFNVSSSDSKIRVSLSWLKYIVLAGTHTTAAVNDHPLADLDLYVYDPNGNKVGMSISSCNNTEIVSFTPTVTGTYRIVIYQYTQSERTVYFGLAWW